MFPSYKKGINIFIGADILVSPEVPAGYRVGRYDEHTLRIVQISRFFGSVEDYRPQGVAFEALKKEVLRDIVLQ
jgi:hypothetical protein